MSQGGQFLRAFDQGRVKGCDCRQCLAGNTLKVSPHAGHRVDHALDLTFTLSPNTVHELAFLVEVVPQLIEFLGDWAKAFPSNSSSFIIV
jgi:hypothetical protein